MNNFENTLQIIKAMGIRITKQRLAFLEMIYNNHYTFNEMYSKLCQKGYCNLATLYNNVDFFLDNGLLTKFYVNNVDFYELVVNNDIHSSNSQIHYTCNKRNILHEVETGDFITYLSKYPYFEGVDVEKIGLMVTGVCKNGCEFEKGKTCNLSNKKAK